MMRLGGQLLFLLCCGAAACVNLPKGDLLPSYLPDVELITWETTSLGPSCGPCNTLKVAAASDGRVWIERGRWAHDHQKHWLVSRSQTTASTEQIASFREQLETVRPSGALSIVSGKPTCEDFGSDSWEVTVVWRKDQREDRLVYDFGCNRREIAVALDYSAPVLLGIKQRHGY